jgi:hypothetical protein
MESTLNNINNFHIKIRDELGDELFCYIFENFNHTRTVIFSACDVVLAHLREDIWKDPSPHK